MLEMFESIESDGLTERPRLKRISSSPEDVDITFRLLTLSNVFAEELFVFFRVVFILLLKKIKVHDSSREDSPHTFDVVYLQELLLFL